MHTPTAQTSCSSAAVPNPKHVPGEPGVWVFILGDLVVFGVFFVYFLVQRMKEPVLFAASQEALNRDLGAINTVFLLVSSLCVVIAIRAIRATERVVAKRFIIGAFLCGIAFIAVKAFEYHERIAAHQLPSTNGFFMLYFVLTGLHLVHLIVGLAVLTALWSFARKPELTTYQWAFFEGGACFWHMVDLLWLVLFPLIFLVR